MRIEVLFILFFLNCFARADNNVVMKLLMANYDLAEEDTVSAWQLIESIDSAQLKSSNIDQQLTYYQLRSIIEGGRKDVLSEIVTLGRAMDLMERHRPTANYLNTALELGCCLKENGEYERADRIVRHALVKGSAIVDSCDASSALFTLLADIKEQQDDSLYANILHKKAQSQSLRYYAFGMGRDSTDIILQRFDNLISESEVMRQHFCCKQYGFLPIISELAYYIYIGGNSVEAIRICEQSLQLARDSMLTNQPWACSAYRVLLGAYVYNKQIEKAKQLLPVAIEYCGHFPEMGYTEEGLYSIIGNSLFEMRQYAEALPYLEEMERIAIKKERPINNVWKERIMICRELK